MNIAEKLEALRTQTPGCALVAFGDIRAKLVLRSSSQVNHPQEYFDEICALAERGFDCQDVVFSSDDGSPDAANDVLIITPEETRLVVRGSRDESDMVFCVCDTLETARTLIKPARRLLEDICRSV